MQPGEAFAQALNDHLTLLAWEERLAALAHYPALRKAFSTSFSLEDQAITHVLARQHLKVRIFTLDTGRLFEATHETHQRTREAYGLSIETYHPDPVLLQEYIGRHGVNGFYDSVSNRLACCHVRKVEPLARALQDTDLWISGVRREHSMERGALPVTEWDPVRRLIKCYPLVDVSQDRLWAFIKMHGVPYNPMFEKGYPSIGCAPCTRAIAFGEHPRAGRWWWEQESQRECGLHLKDGKWVRAAAATSEEAHA